MSEDALTATEIGLIKRASKATLVTFVFIVLAVKQSYFDYPVFALSCAVFAMSALHSTVIFSRLVIGYLLLLVFIPPQTANMLKLSVTAFFSLA